eukprot:183612_1
MDVDETNEGNDVDDNEGSQPQSWMQKLGEYVIWGWIRTHIERKYKNQFYIPIAIKGECLRFLGMHFIDSNILKTEKEKDLLFDILCTQAMHSNILSGLELSFRASDDGFDAASFHRHCDNKSNVITLIESEHGNIFGGYLSIGYQGNNRFAEDKKAFLFSICDPPKIYVIDEWDTDYAVKNLKSSGPALGGGFDLYICDKCNEEKKSYCKQNASSYLIQDAQSFCGSSDNWESAITYQFLVKNYEVFQVLSK